MLLNCVGMAKLYVTSAAQNQRRQKTVCWWRRNNNNKNILKNDFIRTSSLPLRHTRHTSPHNNNNIVRVCSRSPITQHIRTMKHSVLHCRSLLLWFASVTYGWIGKSKQRSASFIVYWHSKPLLLTRIVVLAHTAGLNHWSQCLYLWASSQGWFLRAHDWH